jgi:hypothetical protein
MKKLILFFVVALSIVCSAQTKVTTELLKSLKKDNNFIPVPPIIYWNPADSNYYFYDPAISNVKLDSILAIQRRQKDDSRNIKLNTDNTYLDPFFVSNIPGFRDTTYTVIIDTNASLSGVINLGNRRVKGIQMPASGWVTANLTFQVSYDNGATYQNYYVDDVEHLMTAGNAMNLNANPRTWVGISLFKIRSGTSGTPVNQTGVTAARTIKIRAGNY